MSEHPAVSYSVIAKRPECGAPGGRIMYHIRVFIHDMQSCRFYKHVFAGGSKSEDEIL